MLIWFESFSVMMHRISQSLKCVLTTVCGTYRYPSIDYIQVIIWPRCASRSYWHWGSHIGHRALARGPIWLSSANMT